MRVVVTKVFSDGTQVSLDVADGASVSSVAAQVGAPSNSTFRVNGSQVNGDHVLGNGDHVTINTVKYTAG